MSVCVRGWEREVKGERERERQKEMKKGRMNERSVFQMPWYFVDPIIHVFFTVSNLKIYWTPNNWQAAKHCQDYSVIDFCQCVVPDIAIV